MQRREADGTGAEDQHPVAGPDGRAGDGVQTHRQRLDQRAVDRVDVVE